MSLSVFFNGPLPNIIMFCTLVKKKTFLSMSTIMTIVLQNWRIHAPLFG